MTRLSETRQTRCSARQTQHGRIRAIAVKRPDASNRRVGAPQDAAGHGEGAATVSKRDGEVSGEVRAPMSVLVRETVPATNENRLGEPERYGKESQKNGRR